MTPQGLHTKQEPLYSEGGLTLRKSVDPRVQPSNALTWSLPVITLQRYDSISNEGDRDDYLFVLFFSHHELLPGTVSITPAPPAPPLAMWGGVDK